MDIKRKHNDLLDQVYYMNKDLMTISVLITTRNRAEILKECLKISGPAVTKTG